MRFAWLRETEGSEQPPAFGRVDRLVFVAYNVLWWVPVALAVVGAVSYRAAFIGFLAFSAFRAGANLYRNNVLTPPAAQRFPLRSP